MGLMELLLPHVTDINVCDTEGRTPLHWANQQSNSHAVKLLLSHPDIDVTCKDCNGIAPYILVGNVFADDTKENERNYRFSINKSEQDTYNNYTRLNQLTIMCMLREVLRHKVFATLLVLPWIGKEENANNNRKRELDPHNDGKQRSEMKKYQSKKLKRITEEHHTID
jgi:ankyrin repeat protein